MYSNVKNEVLTRYNYIQEGNHQGFMTFTKKQTFMKYIANLQK